MMQPLKLAPGLNPVNEMMLRTFDLNVFHYFFIIFSSFLHHSAIHQSQICTVHPYKLALSLGPAKEMILKSKNYRFQIISLFFHHSSTIHPSIRVKFICCSHAKLTPGLDSINEIILRAFIFKPSYYSPIHQSQIYIMHLYKLASNLGLSNEMTFLFFLLMDG